MPKGPGLGKAGLWNSGDLDWESCSPRCCKVLSGKAVKGSQVGGSQPSSSPGFAALFCDPEGDSGPQFPLYARWVPLWDSHSGGDQVESLSPLPSSFLLQISLAPKAEPQARRPRVPEEAAPASGPLHQILCLLRTQTFYSVFQGELSESPSVFSYLKKNFF